MSGGHFDYDQYRIRTIWESIRSIIDNNNKKNEWGYATDYSEGTLKYFERAIEILKIAEVYTQRIDWLVSGDDGEETFIKRLHKELAEIKAIPIEPPVMQKTVDGLLPCPFCGGEASIGTTRISDPMTAKLNNRTNGFFVNCKICGANNNWVHLGYATKEIAQHYWNTRK